MLRTRLKALAVAALCALGMPAVAWAAGTTPLSLVQQFDANGKPLINCQLNFFVAGTVSTPQSVFADFGLTTPLPNPLICDASGRVPQHWLADGLIHIRLVDSSGVPQIDTTMQVLGPSSGGGGGGGTVDPTTLMQTGDLKARYGTGAVSGFVRGNGLTIGNATSGATERANADTQNLFVYLYNADANLVVSGGRTGNALNDFNSGKTITLPDWRGRTIAALDDMGNTAAGRLTVAYFGATSGASGTTLGAVGGGESQTLLLGQLPAGITSSGSGTVTVYPNGNPINLFGVSPGGTIVGIGANNSGSNAVPASTAGNWFGYNSASGPYTSNVTSTNTSSNPHPVVQPTMLATIYIRL